MINVRTAFHVFAPNEAVHFLGDYHEILEGDRHACTNH